MDYDEWFICEVEKGLAQIERGEVLTHEGVEARLEKLLIENSRVRDAASVEGRSR